MKAKKTKERIVQSVKKLISKYYPDCFAYGIVGSYASGMPHNNSDIDLLLITDINSVRVTESIWFERYLFDVHLYSKNTLDASIDNEIYNGECTIVSRLKTIEILYDTFQYLENIKKNAKYLFDYGPKSYGSNKLDTHRYAVFSCLNSLRGSYSRDQNIFILSYYMKYITELNSMTKGLWIRTGKHLPEYLKRKDAVFYKELSGALSKFYEYNNKNELIMLLSEILKHSSSNKEIKYCSAEYLNDISKKGAVIKVSALTHNEFITQPLNLFIRMIPELKNNYYISSDTNFKGNKTDYYIIIWYSKKTNHEFYSDKIQNYRFLLDKTFEDAQITFPYNYGLGEPFIYSSIPYSLKKYFNKLSAKLPQLLLRRPDYNYYLILKLAYRFCINLAIKNNINKEIFAMYLHAMYKEAVSEMASSKHSNYIQLKNQLKNYNEEFKQEFNHNFSSSDFFKFIPDKFLSSWTIEISSINLSETIDKNNRLRIMMNGDLNENYLAFNIIINQFNRMLAIKPRDKCFCYFVLSNINSLLRKEFLN